MSEATKFALLRDLAELARKHGHAAFSELADYLRDPSSLDEIVTVLEAINTAGHKTRRRSQRSSETERKSSKAAIQDIISTISGNEPDKANTLSKLYNALVTKRTLPTLKELQGFAVDNGLRPVSAKSRDKALVPFFRDIADRPMEELKAIFAQIRVADDKGDRALEGWANIILGDKQRRNE